MFGSANSPQICFVVSSSIVSIISEVISFVFSLLLFSKTNLTVFSHRKFLCCVALVGVTERCTLSSLVGCTACCERNRAV